MEMSDEQLRVLGEWIERRVKGEPLQYILGEWEFMGLPFVVDRRVLIPRQDTELLCETALERIRNHACRDVLDLCTGSGCIAIALQKLAGVNVTASDISRDALNVAKENAKINDVGITFVESDLFVNIEGMFDLITCNPPYLTGTDMEQMQTEVTFEPALALFGGVDGLNFYKKIAKDYKTHLRPGGTLLLEIGNTQKASVSAIFAENTRVINDLNGNPRVLIVENTE
jgi:release factor glutamine methyltransferase